ncbi:histidine kinase [Croceivirga sp. JEA036]|nr:histidine kinase [Croceivirga sp. JEA036]
MQYRYYIVSFLLFVVANSFSQSTQLDSGLFKLSGEVRARNTGKPIAGVNVSTDAGAYTTTNAFGTFVINARIGEELIFSGADIVTARHRITSKEEVILEVVDYDEDRSGRGMSSQEEYQRYLDSAQYYKKKDIEKSLDFIAKSIASPTISPTKSQLNTSLTLLGEVYLYHQQYDLAVANLQDALKAKKTIKSALLLSEALVLATDYKAALAELKKLEKIKRIVPYQHIAYLELQADAHKGLGDTRKALEFYEESLRVAEQNQVSPKVTDLTSKIADAYAAKDRKIEAEGYYNNSLKLSKQQAPQRAIQENEKVADFYNKSNRFTDEIQLRKESLNQLNALPKKRVAKEKNAAASDSITRQRINYKIANAYIAQDKLEEAIPYLQKSIVEADSEDDLIVQKDATRKLSEVYEYKGDFSKAYQTYQSYVTLVDTLYIRKEQELSRLSRLNRDIVNKQNRISSLEQERELAQSKYNLALTEQQLFQTRTNWQKWLIYSLVAGLALLGLIAFLYYRSNEKQKLANNLLALKSLRTQMNPHFIFNALNSVNNYIAKSDERSANRYLSDFSKLMRTVLENSEEDFIPFAKELELLQLYVKLEHARFPDKFDYDIVIGEEVVINQFEIPPMLIQPYVENAVWHGLRYKKEKGFLRIEIQQPSQHELEVTILDNGIGRKQSAMLKTQHQKKQKSKGMGNIKKRVAILNDMYNNKVDVTVANLYDDETGTKVILRLKKD